MQEKISIQCKKHGKFYQLPWAHKNGSGCKKCGTERSVILKRKTTSEFVSDSRKIYGDNYDYSETEYTNSHTRVNIKCKIHGNFSIVPDAHIYVPFRECPKCSTNKNSLEAQWLKSIGVADEFWQKSIKIGNKKYKLDAYNTATNTVYEFYGDYWHGNPQVYNTSELNSTNGKTFGQLYEDTLHRRKIIIDAGYNFVYMWESTFLIKTLIKEIKEDMKITPENTARLKQLVVDGIQVLQECEDLKQGLSETVKAIAEEFEIKPAIINKMIKDVQKNKLGDRKEENEIMEELLKIAGLN